VAPQPSAFGFACIEGQANSVLTPSLDFNPNQPGTNPGAFGWVLNWDTSRLDSNPVKKPGSGLDFAINPNKTRFF
jgi:hypothetical protein